ncbi:MAG: NnrU family protein [Alphaproteobacteria bacterium]
MDALIAAAAVFVGLHLIPSTPARGWIAGSLGENAYLGLFSIASAAGLVWLILAYGTAPHVELWRTGVALGHAPAIVIPIAFVLLVCGYTTRNPMAVRQHHHLQARDPAPGILKVTRHPLMWAIALWAAAHLAAKGDLASTIFFGALAGLALLGMALQDARKAQTLGAAWGPFALTTSAIPFLAAIQGRAKPRLGEIGWWRIAGGLLLYALVLAAHEWAFGVSPLP